MRCVYSVKMNDNQWTDRCIMRLYEGSMFGLELLEFLGCRCELCRFGPQRCDFCLKFSKRSCLETKGIDFITQLLGLGCDGHQELHI
jgi:hypothetical protein